MNKTTHPVSKLLDHAAFLQRLARQLAGANDGDDLMQETWVAAAGAPPAPPQHARGWLATIATNLWHNQRRSTARRQLRERHAHAAKDVPSPADIAAREEVRRRVVTAVLELPDDLRQVVLLRYYEGLDSAAIGERLALAASTVRTRMQAALDRLRRRLDDEHGSRAAWTGLLAPWLPRSAAVVPIAVAQRGAMLLVSGIAAITVTAWWWFSNQTPSRPPFATTSTAAERVPVGDAITTGSEQRQTAVPNSDVVMPAERGRYPGALPLGSLHGVVLLASTQLPAVGMHVAVRSSPQDCSPFAAAPVREPCERQAVTDDDGRFVIVDLPVGQYDVDAAGPNALHAWSRITAQTTAQQFVLYADEQPSRGLVSVRVVDVAGHAVPGAAVTLALASRRAGDIGWDLRPPIEGTSDAIGVFCLRDRPELEQVGSGGALARDGQGRVGLTYYRRDPTTQPFVCTVTLQPPGTIVGTLTGLASFDGVEVIAHPRLSSITAAECFAVHGVVAADGMFRIADLPTSEYWLEVAGLARRADNEQYWNTARTTVVAGQSTASEPPTIACSCGSRVHGTVRDRSGAPIANAQVTARRPWLNRVDDYLLHHEERENAIFFARRRTRTNLDGQYELALPPGAWQLVVIADGYAMDVHLGVPIGSRPEFTFEHTLVADGALAGLVPDGLSMRAQAAPDVVHTVAGNGFFSLRGLTPGTWQLGSYERGVFTVRESVAIVAGTTQWIDWTVGTEQVHRGVLLCHGEPLAGYDVSIGERGVPVRTAADGSFELRHARADGGDDELQVQFRGLDIESCRQLDGAIELEGRWLDIVTTSADGTLLPALVAIGDTFDQPFEKYKVQNGPGQIQLDDGHLRLLLPQRNEQTSIVATFADGSRSKVMLGDLDRVQLVYRAAGAVDVRCVDATGLPLLGGTVQALPWGHAHAAPTDPAKFAADCADPEDFVMASTDANGHALLRGIPTGPALVRYWPAGSFRPQQGDPGQIITIEASNTVTLSLVRDR